MGVTTVSFANVCQVTSNQAFLGDEVGGSDEVGEGDVVGTGMSLATVMRSATGSQRKSIRVSDDGDDDVLLPTKYELDVPSLTPRLAPCALCS